MNSKGSHFVLFFAILCGILCVILGALYLRPRTVTPAEPVPDSSAPVHDGLTILCPDLGKADGFLLFSDAGAVLIDTGEDPSAEALLDLMNANHIDHLDALVLSHFDKDHIGGAAAILDAIEVGTVYRTAFTEDSEPYTALMDALSRSDAEAITVTDTLTFSAAGGDFTLYPPLENSYDKDEDNNASLMLAASYDGTSLLFTGDAMKARIKEFLSQQYDGTQYDFLKVPHHGQEPRPTSLLLEAFQPPYALITSSFAQPESDKLLERLTEADVKVWLTRNGTVTLSCKDGRISIEQ